MYQEKAVWGWKIGDRRLNVEFDKLHYHVGTHEAMGSYHFVSVPDQRNYRVLEFTVVVPATAEPVPYVVDGPCHCDES